MALNDQEIDKVNELYKQIDVLEVKNKSLSDIVHNDRDSELVKKIDNLTELVRDLACKCTKK